MTNIIGGFGIVETTGLPTHTPGPGDAHIAFDGSQFYRYKKSKNRWEPFISDLSALPTYPNDQAAKAAGLQVGDHYCLDTSDLGPNLDGIIKRIMQ